ncbi:MAG: hypothetical protein DME26_11240 [Verrucomicrobia bacterium]|nr:MAG: hypothetical protein DME26_11240 [Verrucomicrobiota bacterium]
MASDENGAAEFRHPSTIRPTDGFCDVTNVVEMYMQTVRESFLRKLQAESGKLKSFQLSTFNFRILVPFCFLLSAFGLLAQSANDNFADAEDVTGLNGGLFGSVTNDLSSATAEAGEPSHAGFPANATVWYRWTAPENGEVQLDTLSSSNGVDTVLAVYTGNALGTLRQVAANDDVFPLTQFNTRFGFPGFLFRAPRPPAVQSLWVGRFILLGSSASPRRRE